MELSTPVFPFTAIVGQEEMKQALVLSLINPDIGGVLIRGERGTGKSTAVRALASLLPPISVVAGCSFRCDPEDEALMCHQCLERSHQGESLAAAQEPMRVVDLPLGATEEMVLGTLNIEQAVRQGEKSFEPGLLARAHRGFLYVDEVNLLPDHLVDILLDAAAMGVNVVEREGISYSHPSKFILVGTMNPDEGELRPQLQDRFALCAAVQGIKDEEARGQVVRRRLVFEESPQIFAKQWSEKERDLAHHILEAKDRVAKVELPDKTDFFHHQVSCGCWYRWPSSRHSHCQSRHCHGRLQWPQWGNPAGNYGRSPLGFTPPRATGPRRRTNPTRENRASFGKGPRG